MACMAEEMELFITVGEKVKQCLTKMLQKYFTYPLVAVKEDLQALQ
jgi:hypothetical protein